MDKEYLQVQINQKDYEPLNLNEMMVQWSIDSGEAQILEELLGELVRDGQLFLSKKGRYLSIREKGLLAGTLSTHEKGFGFFKDSTTKEEYFIPNKGLKSAMDRDTVLVRIIKGSKGKNKEAQVEKIIKRGTFTFVGEGVYHRGKLIVMPLDRKVFGRYEYSGLPINKGDQVYCRIINYPDNKGFGLVEGISLAKDIDDADLAIVEIMAKYGIPKEFPAEVLLASTQVPTEVTPEEALKRRDLRDLQLVTIDGEDARDFDDAISLERTSKGYHLGVHIADVSYYVPEGSLIDKEALERTTSVYFPDRVLPMLPVSLSNNICSLNEGVDRMAMTCMMELDSKGKLGNYEIFPSVIRSKKRMTYTTVSKILQRQENTEILMEVDEFKDLFSWFDLMGELADCLTKRRETRGAIFFDFPELKIIVDEQGKPIDLAKRVRNKAESIIEEFMLAANETVAEHLFWMEAPCIYRVHEEPPFEGIENFNRIGAPFGLKLMLDASGKIHPKQYQGILEKMENNPMKDTLMNLLLRSMSHARYDIKPVGHFGLSVVYYCHFTSPIRRYPDLVVHRILKRYAEEIVPNEKEKVQINYRAYRAAIQSSEREIAAESAEREVDRVKSAEYMKQFLGDTFTGKISGMINSGIFIQLDNLTEGFLPFQTLEGYYTFFEKELVVRDGGGKIRFTIGDSIQVKLVKAEVLTGRLDFELEEGKKRD